MVRRVVCPRRSSAGGLFSCEMPPSIQKTRRPKESRRDIRYLPGITQVYMRVLQMNHGCEGILWTSLLGSCNSKLARQPRKKVAIKRYIRGLLRHVTVQNQLSTQQTPNTKGRNVPFSVTVYRFLVNRRRPQSFRTPFGGVVQDLSIGIVQSNTRTHVLQ